MKVRILILLNFIWFGFASCDFLDAASYHFHDLIDKASLLIEGSDPSESIENNPENSESSTDDGQSKKNAHTDKVIEKESEIEEELLVQKDHQEEVQNFKEETEVTLEDEKDNFPSEVEREEDELEQQEVVANQPLEVLDKKVPPVINHEVKNNVFEKKEKILPQKNKKKIAELYDQKIPLKPLYHFGGETSLVHLDEKFYFLISGRRVVIYDYYLNEKNSFLLEEEPSFVTSFLNDKFHYLILNINKKLYRLSLSKDAEILSQEILPLNFDNFYGPFLKESSLLKDEGKQNYEIATVYSQNIEFFEIDNFKNIIPQKNIPIAGVDQIFNFKKYYYLIKNNNLTILDRINNSILSSIDFLSSVKILGISKIDEVNYLVLGELDEKKETYQSIRLLKLTEDGRGVIKVENPVLLSSNYSLMKLDLNKPYVYLVSENEIRFYDLKEKKLSRKIDLELGEVKSIAGSDSLLFLTGKEGFGRFDYEVFNYKNNSPLVVQNPNELPTDDDSFAVKWKSKNIKYSLDPAYGILLLGNNQLLAWNNNGSDGKDYSPLFKSKELSQTMNSLSPIPFIKQESTSFGLVEIADYGIFFYDQVKGKIYLMNRELNQFNSLNIGSENLLGLDSYYDGKTDYLLISIAPKNALHESSLLVYLIESATSLKKVSRLKIRDIGGMVMSAKNQMIAVACGKEGLCLITPSQQMKVLRKTSTIKSKTSGSAKYVKISPREDLLLVFFEGENENFISVMKKLKEDFEEVSQIFPGEMTIDQFRGLTFSKGGKILILPHQVGVDFYDLTDYRNPKKEFTWPTGSAYWLDVTNRGKVVCAALGHHGVECANYND